MGNPDFPFPLKAVAGDLAEGMLVKMRGDLQAKCQVPIIVGDARSLAALRKHSALEFDFDKAARQASTVLPESWLARRLKADPESFPALAHPASGKHDAEPMLRLAVGFGRDGQPVPEIYIAQLPGPEVWMSALHLRLPAGDSCPEPFAHAMLARHWEGRHGARLAVITAASIEFTVDHPPATDEVAVQLAREQYIYCPAIVDQAHGSLASLASALKESRTWTFQWR